MSEIKLKDHIAQSMANQFILTTVTNKEFQYIKPSKALGAELAQQHGATEEAALVRVNSFAGIDQLFKAVSTANGDIKSHHRAHTLAFDATGGRGQTRMLHCANLAKFFAEHGRLLQHRDEALKNLRDEYPVLVERAKATLGTLRDEVEYPDIDEVISKYQITMTKSPMSVPATLRAIPMLNSRVTDTAEITWAEGLEKSFNKAQEAAAQSAAQDLASKLKLLSQQISNTFKEKTATGKTPSIRKDLFDKCKDHADLLYNYDLLAADTSELIRSLRSLSTMDAKTVKNSHSTKEKAKTHAADIAKQIDELF
jgi:hypothetical protein